MAKQISQNTFDDVVRENMVDFDMGAEEAMQDAIQQFESQGVNLSVIVKDPAFYTSESQGHPIVTAIKNVVTALESGSTTFSDISQSLITIEKECNIDLARRCLAGTNGAYRALYNALSTFRDKPDCLNAVLLAFCSLVNGQPDLLDSGGIELLLSLLNQYRNNPETLELVVRAIRLNCIKHEENRQAFVKEKLIIMLTELLTSYKSNAALTKEICMNLRALTMDDDIRVPFGQAHENAKTIVTEGDALKTILSLCQDFCENPSVLAELFSTLSCLAVRDEFCQEVMDRGGISLIVGAVHSAINEKVIVRQALMVLKSLAGNDKVKCEIAKLGGIELILEAMKKHPRNAAIAEAVCRVLTTVTLRNVDNCRKVIECDGHCHIVQSMKLHPKEAGVQKNACMALRNLVSRTKDFTEVILSQGAENLLNNAMNQHKDVADEAKAALRDLGCKVELQELWRGNMGNLQE